MRRKIKYLLLLILLLIIAYFAFTKDTIVDNHVQIDNRNPILTKANNADYFELIGYGDLYISYDNQYLNLQNEDNNVVFLSYRVKYFDKELYESGLISPGKMEQFNAYEYFSTGKYTLDYLINVYDLNTKKTLWQDIKIQQTIIVS